MSAFEQIYISLRDRSIPLQAIERWSKARQEARLAFSNPALPPVLIYQMGKVGSRTVYCSLKEADLPNQIIFVHCLSDNLSRTIRNHRKIGIIPVPYHLHLGKAVRKQLSRHPDFPIAIISLVRDPIAITLSRMFQIPEFMQKSVLDSSGSIDPQKAIQEIKRELCNPNFLNDINGWFNREMRTVFGINVFAKPFPLEQGYAEYTLGNSGLLVIRMEDLSEKGPRAISDFLGLRETLPLKLSNVRADSPENAAYQTVLKGISLNPVLCREIYSSKLVKHFYSEAMIEQFISRWTKTSLP